MTLSKRQEELLKAIIAEFIDTAQAVGSLTLSDKYELGVSPATLRLEMSRLVDEGYLFKEHSSAGRVPTTLGMRYFLSRMMEEDVIDKLLEIKLKEKLFQKRYNRGRFIKESVKALSKLTDSSALALVDNVIFTSGISCLASLPEFEDTEVLQTILSIIESEGTLNELFEKYLKKDDLTILIGDEIGIESLNDCSIVFSPFRFFRGDLGYIASIGSRRMHYSKVLPAIRSIANFIEESIVGWD